MSVLLVLVVVGVGAVALLSERENDAGGGSETVQVVRRYLHAADTGDCEALIDLVTEASVQMIGGGGRPEAMAACQSELSGGEGLAAAGLGSIQNSEEADNDGTTATVAITTTADGDTEETVSFFSLRNEGGAWKLDLTAPGRGRGGPAGWAVIDADR